VGPLDPSVPLGLIQTGVAYFTDAHVTMDPNHGDSVILAVVAALPFLGFLGYLIGDPGFAVTGSVVLPDGAASGAHVELRCPRLDHEYYPRIFGSVPVNSAGRFRGSAIGCLPRSCTVVVKLGDGRELKESVGDHCVDHMWKCGSDHCNAVHVDFAAR
jgi:hypothetical protein